MSEKFSKLLLPASIIVAGIIIAGALVYLNQEKNKETEDMAFAQQIAEKAIGYINENFNVGDNTASLIGIEDVGSGVYKIELKIGEQEYESYASKDGRLLFPEGYDLEEEVKEESEENSTTQKRVTIGDFSVNEDEICREDGKPIVYFFGSSGCPHCTWEHPVIEKVAEKFGEYILFHDNLNSDADSDIFSKYSTGGVPTLILGCKYSRVGSGSRSGEEGESQALTALICKLTDSQPSNICNLVQGLIDQIE